MAESIFRKDPPGITPDSHVQSDKLAYKNALERVNEILISDIGDLRQRLKVPGIIYQKIGGKSIVGILYTSDGIRVKVTDEESPRFYSLAEYPEIKDHYEAMVTILRETS